MRQNTPRPPSRNGTILLECDIAEPKPEMDNPDMEYPHLSEYQMRQLIMASFTPEAITSLPDDHDITDWGI